MSENFENEIFNEEEMDDVVILADEDGNELEFEFIDVFEYEGDEYVVLLPVDETSRDVVILKIEETDDPEVEDYVAVESEEALNAVYKLFKEAYKDEFNFED